MISGVTRHMLPHLSELPHLHVNRPLASLWKRDGFGQLGNGLLIVISVVLLSMGFS